MHLTVLPVKPLTVRADLAFLMPAALSSSGRELAVATATSSGGLVVQVFSVATGQLLHQWATSHPLTATVSGNPVQTSMHILTWIDNDQVLALESYTSTPGAEAGDTIRELSVSGSPNGDLLAATKVTLALAPGCIQGDGEGHLISDDGTTIGCTEINGSAANPSITFRTYAVPLTAHTRRNINYQVLDMERKGVNSWQALWISPDGSTMVAAWTVHAKDAITDAPNGLHIGAASNGKFTPLHFPAGFDQKATIETITW